MRGRFQGNTITLAAGECVGRNFTQHIGESIQAYFSGYKMVAIIALAPVLEGIVRRIAASQSRDIGQGTKKLNHAAHSPSGNRYRYASIMPLFAG